MRAFLFALLACVAIAAPATTSTFNISHPFARSSRAVSKTEASRSINADDSPVVVQVRVVQLVAKSGRRGTTEDTRELLVTPPVLQIPANGQQIVAWWRSGAIRIPRRS